jgi:hypothetical protein
MIPQEHFVWDKMLLRGFELNDELAIFMRLTALYVVYGAFKRTKELGRHAEPTINGRSSSR